MELLANILEFCVKNLFAISIALLVLFLVYIFLVVQIHELVGNITRFAFHSYICSEQSELLSTLLYPLKVDQLNADRLLDVLDISGINCPFEHLPTGCQLTCWEPNPYGRPFLEKKAEESERVFLKEILSGPIGDLDKIEDGSFDIVVSHMSLCSVSEPEEVLVEIHRLLRPGGSFYFLEHVADRMWFMRFLQLLSLPLLFILGGKCRPNRHIWQHINESEFATHSYERFRVGAFSVRCPVIVGTATKSA